MMQAWSNRMASRSAALGNPDVRAALIDGMLSLSSRLSPLVHARIFH